MLSATVKEVKRQTPDTKSFTLELEEGSEMEFKPGQHIVVCFEKGGQKVFRPYSLTSLPENLPEFELCVRKYDGGTASVYMHERKKGDRVSFNRPTGNLYLRNEHKGNVFLATGTGITPMMGMIRQLLQGGGKRGMWLFFGVRTGKDIIFREDFEAMAENHENFHFIPSLSRPDDSWMGKTGHVQERIEDYLQSFQDKDFYICGVPKMVVQTIEKLKSIGVPEENIYSEGWEKSAAK